jgi:N-acetylglucosaminyldiphosphoundecaprenol N-acetyl-beta-D-mannosaminyltransferase
LWVRYGKTIPPFLYLAIRQLLVPYRNKLNQLSVHSVRSIDITNLNNSPICLGQILVRQGILTESSLNQVLAEQSEFPDLKLGQILINKNLISLHQLKYYLKNQKIMLGEILVERKLIKTSQLDSILNLEKERDRRIGEILIERRLISEKQLEDALIEQYWRWRGLWLHHKRIEKKTKKYVSLDKQDKVPQ